MYKYHAEVLQHLHEGLKTDKPSKFKDLKKYIGTNYEHIGLSVPKQRLIFKTGFSFSHMSLKEQLDVWNDIWMNSNHYELMNIALLFAGKHLSQFDATDIWDVLKNWVTKTDNWAHSDGLSSIYAQLLEQQPEMVYAQYTLWNTSHNPWERRQSIVGLLYYSRIRKNIYPYKKLVAMVQPLLKDENYFVQKGIGWTLREMWNVYPTETLAFLKAHITDITATAFTAAIEKLDVTEKQQLKEMRKLKKNISPAQI